MIYLRIAIYLFSLGVILIMGLFSLLYIRDVHRAKFVVGMTLPRLLYTSLHITMYTSLFYTVLIALFLMQELLRR